MAFYDFMQYILCSIQYQIVIAVSILVFFFKKKIFFEYVSHVLSKVAYATFDNMCHTCLNKIFFKKKLRKLNWICLIACFTCLSWSCVYMLEYLACLLFWNVLRAYVLSCLNFQFLLLLYISVIKFQKSIAYSVFLKQFR